MGAELSSPGRKPFNFSGKHAFLTGGANGIGLSICKLLLERGASITFTDIIDSSNAISCLRHVVLEKGLPSQINFIKADVTQYAEMTSAVIAAEEKLGPIDCLIPNAGIASGGLFIDEDIKALERVNSVNLMGVIYTLKAALPRMLERKKGQILMIASLMAMYAGFCSSAYVAPKAAVLSLANALRLELLGTGVEITISMPAFTDTAMRTDGLHNPRSPDFAKELTRELKVYTPDQVAEWSIQGVEKGLFFAKSTDFFLNVAVSSMAGVAPKLFSSVVELLLLPLYYILHTTVRHSMDKRILAWRKEQQTGIAGRKEVSVSGSVALSSSKESTSKTN